MKSLAKPKNIYLSLGFTMIELLIVILALGILLGTFLVILNPKQLMAQVRDAQRLSDLENLTNALNLALADNEILLTSTLGTVRSSTSYDLDLDGLGYVNYTIPQGKVGLSKYLPLLPIDPINTSEYAYFYSSDGVFFELNTKLESEKNLQKMQTDGGNDPTLYEIGTSAGFALISF